MLPEALNAICPYYTMFPLDFPLRLLQGRARKRDRVVDPFCGRGTTNFAARLVGLSSFGVDSSPIAVALSQAKIASSTPRAVTDLATRILHESGPPQQLPTGTFWKLAYHHNTLYRLCQLREELLQNCRTETRVLLRAIVLGALHGPLTKLSPSHFSNQSPRTFAPKPDYATRFWRSRQMLPPDVDVTAVIKRRAARYLTQTPDRTDSSIAKGDSRIFDFSNEQPFDWVITSPPYYGMRTYIPDQWLRFWFLGGPNTVEYSPPKEELAHNSADAFVANLAAVWNNVASACRSKAQLVARFGAINERKADPRELMRESLAMAGWRLRTACRAGSANDGRRQAVQFRLKSSSPITEYDFYAVLAG